MTKYTTVFGDLLRHFSRYEFDKAVSDYKGDFRTRVLNCFDLFKTMLYAHLSCCFSVRDIEATMKANRKSLYHAGLKQPIKRSTFCDALEKRPHSIFKTIFHELSDKAQKIAGRTKMKYKDPLRIIDMSVIPLCLKRFDWAKFRKSKGAVKLHLNHDGDNQIPFDAYLTNGTVHESQAAHFLCQETGVIYVMDRGYIDYNSLYNIELRGSIFVTRMKSNAKYRRIKNILHKQSSSIISDLLIELTGPITKTHYQKPLRKVKYCDPESKRIYEFMTNDIKSDALEIAAIYKERWEVELFFKWIKQHLKIKSFWGTSMNAVYSQIWMALISAILIWINRVLNGINYSAHELLVMLKTVLLTKNSLSGLCTNISEYTVENYSIQPFLEGFTC